MPNKKSLSIEEAFRQLQTIVAEFENQEIDLDKSIPKFKRGIQLATFLKQRLSLLQTEVEEIKAQFESQTSQSSSPPNPSNSNQTSD